MLTCNTNINTTDPHRGVAKLPLFLVSTATTVRSPRSFDGDGAVGLGIVAAMMMSTNDGIPPPRSDPIAIHSPRPATSKVAMRTEGEGWGGGDDDDDDEKEEEEELSESYTCVITHLAGNTVKKRVYSDHDDGRSSDDGRDNCSGGVFFYQSPLPTADFLSSCYLCRKNLRGLDIFMYRDDKAFCSSECRCQQILSDEYRENCGSGALKTFEYPASPLLFAAGVAAA